MSDDLPFVARPPSDAAAARAAATAASAQWGLPAPEHLRTGMNALFAAGDDVILRVAHTTAAPAQAAWLMGQLKDRGVSVPRFVRAEPLEFGDLAVFAIERIVSVGDVDWAAVGEQIRRVHEWPIEGARGHYPLPPCESFPWWNTATVLADVDDLLDSPARAGLMAAIHAHGDWRARVSARVVCHGDVHPGNIIQSADGPVLLDWDLACHAPAAWDHAMLLTWSSVWGGDSSAYERFAAGYGQSLADDPLAQSLAVMRNVTATLMRLKAGTHRPSGRRRSPASPAVLARRPCGAQLERSVTKPVSWAGRWGRSSRRGRRASRSGRRCRSAGRCRGDTRRCCRPRRARPLVTGNSCRSMVTIRLSFTPCLSMLLIVSQSASSSSGLQLRPGRDG